MGLIGYLRVSRIGDREGEGYISPTVQREAIEAYAGELGVEITSWADDQDFSGGNTERPAFQAALAELEAGAADGIVVMRIDRFARSVADGARIVREIVDRGQVFASCHERIDPRTPEGRFMLTSFLANAELFLDQAKAGWKVAKARAVARGVHIGPTPIGYRREKSQPLEPDPVMGPAITRLFERASSGEMGDTALARWLNDEAPPADRRGWQSSEVRRWLSSRVYLGEVRYGDLVNAEAHPALTDPDTWDACQREPRMQRKALSNFLLSGLVRCASCRYSMGGQTYGGPAGQTPVYRCTNRDCPAPAVITTKRLDAHIRELALAHLEGLRAVEVTSEEDLSSFDRALREAQDEMSAFAADLEARRLLGEDGWRQALAARAAARDEAQSAREAAYGRAARTGFAIDLGELDFHGLRDFLRGLIRAVYVRRGRGAVEQRVLVEFSDQAAPIELPGPHVSGPFDPVEW